MTERPVLRIVRGEPTDEELAALTAVVMALPTSRSAAPDAGAQRRSAWSDRSALLRRMPHPGPNVWRASSLPGTGRLI